MMCPSLIGWYRSRFFRLNKRNHFPLLRVNLHITVPPLSPLARAAASSNRLLKMSGGDGDMVVIAEKDDNPGTEDLVSEDPKEISEEICEAVEYIRKYLKKSNDEAYDMVELEQLEELHNLLAHYLKSMDEIKDTVGEEVDKLNRGLTQQKEESSATSSSEAAPFDKIQRQIGENLVLSKEIGQGSERRLELSDQEIQNLIPSDHCQNIVTYHGVEHDTGSGYLAMERCDCSLDDLIQMSSAECFDQNKLVSNEICYNMRSMVLYDDRLENQKKIMRNVKLYKENNSRPSPLLLKLMRDIVSEIVHLHDLDMIHGDLKPQNISIIKGNSTLHAKISDMGTCKRLLEDKSSPSNRFSGCAVTRWKAPEQLLHRQQTSATDLFSLGCVLFFCITGGRHPFGDDERDENIRRNNKPDLLLIEDIPEAFHLISSLLKADPKIRPTAIEVLHHPLFWDAEKRLSFLCDTSYRLREKSSNLFRAIERIAYRAFDKKSKGPGTWGNSMDIRIIKYASRNRKIDYEFSSVRDLLRLIRHMFCHYGELPKDIQMLVGPLYEGFNDYITSQFPMLVIEVYEVVCRYCREEERFRRYFKGNL